MTLGQVLLIIVQYSLSFLPPVAAVTEWTPDTEIEVPSIVWKEERKMNANPEDPRLEADSRMYQLQRVQENAIGSGKKGIGMTMRDVGEPGSWVEHLPMV